jgi:hypothetical protein
MRVNRDRVYYNGVSQPFTSVAWNGTVSYSDSGLAMARQMYPDGYVRYFQSSIDEVRIYSRVLTQAEIQALMLNYDPGEFQNGG